MILNDVLDVSKAFRQDMGFILELDSSKLEKHLQLKETAMSKLQSAQSSLNVSPTNSPQAFRISKTSNKVSKGNLSRTLPEDSNTSRKEAMKKEKQQKEKEKAIAKEKKREEKEKEKRINYAQIGRQVSVPVLKESTEKDDTEDEKDVKYSCSDDSYTFPKIKAASIDKLIERLTHETYPDIKFRTTFMLTYRSFMEPRQLLQKLDHRLSIIIIILEFISILIFVLFSDFMLVEVMMLLFLLFKSSMMDYIIISFLF